MDLSEIAHRRLHSQRISREKFAHPGQAVSWFGAMQAQDYASVKWGVGLRCRSATRAMVEGAVASKTILRTWLMRGTLHIAAASDVRWMLALLAPRLIANSARRNRQLELDEGTFTRSFDTLTDALDGGKPLTRAEIMDSLERAGVSTAGQRGYHILRRAGLEGLICFGPMQDNQETFVLLDEWAPRTADANPADGLAELAGRYFQSHGPAALGDFIWWSGLKAAEARAGLEMAEARLHRETVNGEIYWSADEQSLPESPSPAVHLLPAFDEYFLGYKDRSAVLDPEFDSKAIASGGVFRPMIVVDGQIAGTWKRALRKDSLVITPNPFNALTKAEHQALHTAADRVGAFLGLSVVLAE